MLMRLFRLLRAQTNASNLTRCVLADSVERGFASCAPFFCRDRMRHTAGGRIDLKIGTQIGVKVFEGLRHVLAAVAKANVARFVVHASRKQHYA